MVSFSVAVQLLTSRWSWKMVALNSPQDLQIAIDLLSSILINASQMKSAYENLARTRLANESRLAESPCAGDKQCVGNQDNDTYLVWSDDEAPTEHNAAVEEVPSAKSNDSFMGAAIPVGRHKRLKLSQVSNMQDETADDDTDTSSTMKDGSSSSDTQGSEENQSVFDHDTIFEFGDWELIQVFVPAAAGQV